MNDDMTQKAVDNGQEIKDRLEEEQYKIDISEVDKSIKREDTQNQADTEHQIKTPSSIWHQIKAS